MTLAALALSLPTLAQAVVTPPVTIAGPASDIVDFGGVAMAPDGSGGAVFTKIVDGVPHVFASRFVRGGWSAPMRVDDLPYEASQPAIAAGRGGELQVVWVTQVATVQKKVRYGLYSARIDRGASSFQPALLVDPEVGSGDFAGVDPSLSGTATGIATVAYRVVTFRFEGAATQGSQLRPGDVLADIRIARLKDDRWSRLGAINVNQEVSTRAPTAANAPQVGAGTDGGAVVAWQESDQSGTSRLYLRRLFGTVPGPVLQVSPSSWEGAPVSGDVDAFSLAVTPFDQARVAMRIPGGGGQGPTRVFLNTLPPNFAASANAMVGSQEVFRAPAATEIGVPGLAAYEKGGAEGQLRLGFAAAGLHQMTVDGAGKPVPLAAPEAPAPIAGAEVATALDPDGGGTVAYPALDGSGRPAVAVRQEFKSGAAQLGFLSGSESGPIAAMRLGSSGGGDSLIGFRQGDPGHFQIVVARVSAPPTPFKVSGPKGWTRPRRVKLRWQPTSSAVGGVTYSVLVDGQVAKRGLRRRAYRLPPSALGNGRSSVKVLATDALGQQVLSKRLPLRVDGQPPLVRFAGPHGGGVAVRISDPDAGPASHGSWVSFGDGSREKGGSRFSHTYARPGRYLVVAHARDRAGNRVVRRFEVRVG